MKMTIPILSQRKRKRGKPVQYERNFQRSVVRIWAQIGAFERGILFAVPNGELRDKGTAFLLSGNRSSRTTTESLPGLPPVSDFEAMVPHGLGVLPGAPDLILLCAARAVLIECKNSGEQGGTKGSLTKSQKRFRACAQTLGFQYEVIETERQFIKLLESLDLLRVKFNMVTGQYSVPIIAAKPFARSD
jgi:hypothetical protein